MKAVGYIRVSTEGQAVDGVSLEAQKGKIEAWCLLNGYTLAHCFIDAGISGKRADNRPELQAALAAVGNGDALVVYSLSRLARSTRDTMDISDRLTKAGADLVSLSEKIDTTSAAGKMVFRMLAVLAEFERDQVSERTTMALAHKKAKGERVGSVPYGYRLAADGIALEADATEQELIALVTNYRAEGMNYSEIARRLDQKGILPRGGKKWHHQSVKNILEAA